MITHTRLATAGVVGVVAIGAAVAPVASATTVSLFGPDTRFGSQGEVFVSGGDAKDHQINIVQKHGDDAFVITDSRRFGALDSGCGRITRHKVRCQTPAPTGAADVAIHGAAGDDRLRVDDTVEGFATIDGGDGADVIRVARAARGGGELQGGDGADRIIGGRGGESIGDGDGADLVRGRGGEEIVFVDLFSQDRGHNRIFTGAGADLILAKNGHRDEVLDCGGGRDEAGLDRIDPKPRSCEDLRRYRGTPRRGRQ
ncbi:MAG: hypothetical protein GEU88_09465 [Solirubrobacterales bacterium]|nr:hypothetical protein [Solirubrobacterales bacterium]